MLGNMEDYSEYIIQGEPDKRERVRNWMAAIHQTEKSSIIIYNIYIIYNNRIFFYNFHHINLSL